MIVTHVIGQAGKTPKGVTTDRNGERARDIAPAARKRGTGSQALGEKRQVVIMLGHKVPYPLMGDRRALMAPNYKGPKGVPRASRAFGVVEFAGRTCVKVHGATDDYRQAVSIAQVTAGRLHRWLTREIARKAANGGSVIGKPLPPVQVIDRTGIYPGPKRPRKTSTAAPKREAAPVSVRTMTDAERVTYDHKRSIQSQGSCPACVGTDSERVKNARCVAAPVSEGVAQLREELAEVATPVLTAESMTAALQAASKEQ
ncbi:hypothetical protein [Streptomyces sp. NPDC017448]|uniref:hypothetical protein n=1 Tax=Streptomyces sp. NPDC017448 TaxID=3364996 RepID=UPI00379CF43D